MARARQDSAPFPEAAEQASELAALERLLDISAGTASLCIAICNAPALRDYLIERVLENHPDLAVVPLPRGCVDVYGEVTGTLKDQPVSAVFVTGIEDSVSSGETTHLTLKSLNASRDLWASRFACPVVFWMPAYVAALLPIHAPDLWSYRSHSFEFAAPTRNQEMLQSEPFAGDWTLASNLDVDQKHFRIAELEQRIKEAGDSPPPALLPHKRAWLRELGWLYGQIGDIEEAEALHDKAYEISVTHKWLDAQAEDLTDLGNIANLRGNLREAELFYRNALTIDRRLGRLERQAYNLGNLGNVVLLRGDLDEAERLFREALDIQSSLGRRASNLCNLGIVARMRGDLDEAERLYRCALEMEIRSGRLEGQANNLGNLGIVARLRGDLDEAERLHREALDIDQRLGLLEGQANDLANIGIISETRGNLDEARHLWLEARDLYARLGMAPMVEKTQRRLNSLPPH
jgi:tetratricopeptide (TPR) repeat protein